MDYDKLIQIDFMMFNDQEGYDITSNTFKTQYANALYWSPRTWSPSGTVQPLILTTNTLPSNVTKFNIYVTETGSCLANFEKLNTSWQGTGKDITKVAVDRLDPYFASLLAAIIISHKGGICKKHLTGDAQTPKIITSISRYYDEKVSSRPQQNSILHFN